MIEIFSDGTYGGTRVIMDGRWELKCIRSLAFHYDFSNRDIPLLNLDIGIYGLSRGTCDAIFEPLKAEDFLHYVKICDTEVDYRLAGHEDMVFTVLDVIAEHPNIEFVCA